MDKKEVGKFIVDNLPHTEKKIKRKSYNTLTFGNDGYLYIVKEGLILTVRNDANGRYKGIGLYDKGALIGIGGVLQENRDICCYAISDTIVYKFTTKDFLRLIKANHELCYNYAMITSDALLYAYNDLEINTLGTLEEKIQDFEQRLEAVNLPIDATASEIVVAMGVGAHPGSVSRAKKSLKDKDK